MAEDPKQETKIHAPDRSLHAKIGNANLDQVLSPQVVEGAQSTIRASSEQFWSESMTRLAVLDKFYDALGKAADAESQMTGLASEAFALKVSAGLGGYTLVSSLAKSLHKQCELLGGKKPAAKNLELIKWHIESIRQLLSAKVAGDGGAVGASIAAELERLAP